MIIHFKALFIVAVVYVPTVSPSELVTLINFNPSMDM